MNRQPANQFSNQPLGTSGDLRRRLLLHHAPIALASAVLLALFMSLPIFDAHAYPHADIVTGMFPQERRAALRKLKARPWKWLQRLNYALFALVILHAFFYGALLRMTSPFYAPAHS